MYIYTFVVNCVRRKLRIAKQFTIEPLFYTWNNRTKTTWKTTFVIYAYNTLNNSTQLIIYCSYLNLYCIRNWSQNCYLLRNSNLYIHFLYIFLLKIGGILYYYYYYYIMYTIRTVLRYKMPKAAARIFWECVIHVLRCAASSGGGCWFYPPGGNGRNVAADSREKERERVSGEYHAQVREWLRAQENTTDT